MVDMKRWLSGLLAALTLFSLAACGGMEDPLGYPEETQVENTDLPAADGTEDSAVPPDEEDPPGPGSPDTADPDGPEKEGNTSSAETEDPLDVLSTEANSDLEECWVREDGSYTTKEDVACYIHFYGHLPDNFITKREAEALGWSGGSLEPYAPGQNLCIGGNRFGNYEGLLPEAEGRTYTECDIDTLGARSRGAKRIVFSNDGLIYYTEDHYASFELLYGDESNG